MNKTDLHSSLLFLMLKLEEAKSNPMSDKNFVAALTEVLKYFRDNGELKKVYKTRYWAYRFGYYHGKKDSGKIAGDHRLIKAIKLTKK